MKQKTIAFYILLIPICALAQEIDPKYEYIESKQMILDNSIKDYPAVIGHDSNSFYVLKKEYVNYIEKYNWNLELEKESEFLKVDVKLKDRQFNYAVFFQDSLYMFYSEVKFMKTYLYVKTINKNTLEQNDNERLICEIPHFKANFPDIRFKLSLLHNKLLMVFQTDAYLQKTIKFDFFVFDKGLNIVWQKTDYLQYNHNAPREYDYTVDEDGNIHILALIYQIRFINHVITDESLKNEYLVVSYLQNGEQVVENRLSLEDRFIRGIKLVPGEEGTYVCAGFYSNLYRYGIKGAFFVTNNIKTKQNEPVLYYEFNDAMIEKLPDINKSSRTEEIYSYDIKDLVYRKNGNIFLCGEQVYEQSYNNYNDIIMVSFSPYGDMLWNRVIRKTQSGHEYVSFTMVAPVTENDVYILYNEHHKNKLNENMNKRNSFHFSTPSYLVVAKVDPYGVVEKDKVLPRKKRELIPDPTKTYDMRNGDIVMYASRYRKYKYFKLSLFKN